MSSTLVREFLTAVRTTVFPPSRRRSASQRWGSGAPAIVEAFEPRVLLTATPYETYQNSVATADAAYTVQSQLAAYDYDTEMLNADAAYNSTEQSAWNEYDGEVSAANAVLTTAYANAGTAYGTTMDAANGVYNDSMDTAADVYDGAVATANADT